MDERTVIVKQGSFGSFLRGMAVGAVLALLFAPRSGRETRYITTEKGTEFKDKAVDVANVTRDKAQTLVSDARNKVGDTVKRVSEKVERSESEDVEQLKRELAISDDIENREYPL